MSSGCAGVTSAGQTTGTGDPPPTLAVTVNSLPTGATQTAYSAVLSASGGTTPYTWSISSGQLPTGLSLNASSGAISGTPTAAGAFTFTAKVTDSGSPAQTASAGLSITITSSKTPMQISVTALPAGETGASYRAILSATGGTAPYTWSLASGSLPAGLALSTSGDITGTPTQAGTTSFTVKATDSSSPAETATQSLSITIAAAGGPLQITTLSLPSGQVGTAYSTSLAAIGGTTPYSWSVTSGSLPAGVSLNATSGAISGTPTTAETSSFTIQVKDSSVTPGTATRSFSVTIAAAQPPTISTSSLPGGTVGTAYSTTLAATGGKTPYTWSISSGSLPAGLSLAASTGVISGTPTTSGTASFTVQVKDANSSTATKSLSIVVAAAQPPTISTSSLPGGTVGTSYSTTLAATGGKTPYTWSITSGSLPAGLSLASSTGVISGTPTTSGTASFTVQVKDANNSTATKSLSIVVAAAAQPPTISTSSLPGGTVGTAYSTTLAATGGTTPYTWSVTSGALPAGLSIAASTGVISGTPTTSGTASFTVQVKDANNSTATKSLSIVVAAAAQPPSISTSSLPGGTVNSSYSTTLTATGGKTPYSWSISSGSLPAGLSLAASTGIISGTPTASGTSSFTVKVTDSSSPAQTATKSLSIAVTAPALQITTASLPGGIVGTSYSAVMVASGGTSPYTWSLSSGSLPAGLSLSSAGQITGTPTTAASSSFTVKVTDSASNTATEGLSISVLAPNGSDPLNTSYQPTPNCTSGFPSNIWITNDLVKVRQDSGTPGTTYCALIWGTQNEFVDFQVHLHDTGSGTPDMSVTISNLVGPNPSNTTTISASTNSIVVYREAYQHVTTKTASGDTFYNTAGYFPDALIPAVDPYFHQTTNAWPVSVPAGDNQSAWIDILVPKTAPSGYYTGTVTVTSGSTILGTYPVVLGVWQWPGGGYMPSTATLKSDYALDTEAFCVAIYGSYNACSAYPGAGGSSDTAIAYMDADGASMFLDHRMSLFDPPYAYDDYGRISGMPYGPLLNGSTANAHAPTMLVGAKGTNAEIYGASPGDYSTWAANWASYGYTGTLEAFNVSEPSGSAWTSINTRGAEAHATTPKLSTMASTDLVNVTANGALDNLDVIVANWTLMQPIGGVNTRSTYNTWLAGNCCGTGSPTRQLWSYISCSNGGTCGNGTIGPSNYTYANVDVDGVPAANQAEQWLDYWNGQTGFLYYDVDCYWVGGCYTGSPNNPWTAAVYAFGNNGDGTLAYPSSFGGTNYVTNSSGGALTTPLWIPSIRMKEIRDGEQDYEYLNVLTNNGEGVFAMGEASSWITNSYTFDVSAGSGAGTLTAARCALGGAIHQLTYSSSAGPTCQASSGSAP